MNLYAVIGIYETTNVYLDGNLTRFDSDVYRPILEQMIDFGGGIDNAGFIDVGGSNYILLVSIILYYNE